MWLYSFGEACGSGSWARGDWDSRSDVDLIAVAPTREEADQLADALLSACLGDHVIALDAARYPDGDQAPSELFDRVDADAAITTARAVVAFARSVLP